MLSQGVRSRYDLAKRGVYASRPTLDYFPFHGLANPLFEFIIPENASYLELVLPRKERFLTSCRYIGQAFMITLSHANHLPIT